MNSLTLLFSSRPLNLANSSLSEGEVPLSPGDARWYTLSAGVAKETRQKSVGNGGGTTVLQDFLDLKNSCDPSDASEQSDSQQESRSKVYFTQPIYTHGSYVCIHMYIP